MRKVGKMVERNLPEIRKLAKPDLREHYILLEHALLKDSISAKSAVAQVKIVIKARMRKIC